MQLAGARWYSPNAFRWLSRDPIHYRGGDNLSTYVTGNPVKYVDPSGLQSLPSNVREMFEPHFPRKVLDEAYFRRGMPWFGPSEDDARGFAPNWNVYIDKATYDRLFHKNGPQCSESDYELIAHDLTHVEQYWANPIFRLDYAFKHLRYGYRRNPMEKEANEKVRNIIESLKEGKHDLRP